jgi:ribA/ribD-fused uncharacterized protein
MTPYVPPREITQFVGAHRFLSNYYVYPLHYDGTVWQTAEHAFQAAKTENSVSKKEIRKASTAAQAKFLGRNVTLRADWNDVKRNVMLDILRHKFRRGGILAQQLLATDTALLIEGNTWHDTYWGAMRMGDKWIGDNWLGKILMHVRNELRANREQRGLFDPAAMQKESESAHDAEEL